MMVVSNSGPIIHLSMGRQIGLIPRLFGEVLVPRTVYREVVEDGAGLPGSLELRTATWTRVVDVDRTSFARLAGEHLDPGETAAIALSIQERAERLLVDDREARDVAARLGIPVIGTLGILLAGLRVGAISRIAPVLAQMKQQGFWVSPQLERDVLRQAGEDHR
jgi:predicted nucleic acid-binding protein